MLGYEPPWEACCLAHDRLYWQGSAVNGFELRLQADQALKQCVIDTGERLSPALSRQHGLSEAEVSAYFDMAAELMFSAVRMGGTPCSLLPWRWGYGWPHCAFAAASDASTPYSDIRADEWITFFATDAWLDEDGSHWNLPVHAWVYEPEDSVFRKGVFSAVLEEKYQLSVSPETEGNFTLRTNLILSDNERGKALIVRLAGKDIRLPLTAENGQVRHIIRLSVAQAQAFSHNGWLSYIAVIAPSDGRAFKGFVRLVPGHGITVISDIDDTIKVSRVTDRKALFDYTFFRDFQAAPGMVTFYQQLAQSGAVIHFVSSSPWQLYDPLQTFMEVAGFPSATMSLKQVRFRDETFFNLFKKGTQTKPEQIQSILQRYPERQFILIGDSGEQDPEVYGEVARQYPRQVRQILIRNVDGSSAAAGRYVSAFRGIDPDKWQLFAIPSEESVQQIF